MSETLNTDLNGIFIRKKHSFLCFEYNTYMLRPSVTCLIHTITKIKESYLLNITVFNNIVFLPKRYSGITWGRKSSKAYISLRKQYFNNTNPTMKDITELLEILVHESVHIKQIDRYRFLCFGLLPYLIAHAFYYIKTLSHDLSPLEREPLSKQHEFINLNTYINKVKEPYFLAKLLSDKKINEGAKIKTIKTLCKTYYDKN